MTDQSSFNDAAASRVAEFRDVTQQLRHEIGQVIVGQDHVVEHLLITLFVGGHCLVTGMPGTAKTLLVRTLADALGLEFNRIQFTPDLMPTDITGTDIIEDDENGQRQWRFVPGPIFTNVLLADEINRATPRTQSALFEAMAERQVTIDNQTMPLASTFLVIATQNPIESHGAYPLPEAQLDRFAIKLSIGYPARADEIAMLADNIGSAATVGDQQAVMSLHELSQLQDAVKNVEVTESIRGYFVDLATATRQHPDIATGLSPRGVIIWQRMAQAWAYLQGRQFVIPDDVKTVAKPVLQLRIASNARNNDAIIEEIINSINVPGM